MFINFLYLFVFQITEHTIFRQRMSKTMLRKYIFVPWLSAKCLLAKLVLNWRQLLITCTSPSRKPMGTACQPHLPFSLYALYQRKLGAQPIASHSYFQFYQNWFPGESCHWHLPIPLRIYCNEFDSPFPSGDCTDAFLHSLIVWNRIIACA